MEIVDRAFPNMSTLIYTILASFITSLVSLVGIVFLLGKTSNRKYNLKTMVSFAAGVLLATAFMDILNEALDDGSKSTVLFVALIGIVLSFFLERFVLWYHHHHNDTHHIKPSAYLVIIGDGVHNFIDGIAIAATFSISVPLGIMTTIAIVSHEIPQEIADFMILVRSGFTAQKALVYNFISALTAVLGGFFGIFLVNTYDYILPYALALTAGVFIYIATADLIPELHVNHDMSKPLNQAMPFILGVGLIVFLTQFMP